MNFKSLALFFAGAAVGAFATRFYLKERYEKMLADEIEVINKKYTEEISALYSADETRAEKSKTPESVDDPVQYQKEQRRFKTEENRVAYEAYFRKKEVPEEMAVHPAEVPDTPYAISASEFNTDRSHDKTTLMYYANADVLCEDWDEIESPEDILGPDWRDNLEEIEGSVVYIRNEKLGADYEVIYDNSDADWVRSNLGFGAE